MCFLFHFLSLFLKGDTTYRLGIIQSLDEQSMNSAQTQD